MAGKNQLKIAYIGQKGIPVRWGGVERATEELAVRAARAGHAVTVYCRAWYTGETPSDYRGVSLVYLPSIHTKHLDAISHSMISLAHALWHGTDVIHFQGIGPALLAWIPFVFARHHTKVFVTFHCLDRRLKKWNFFARAVFWCAEWIAMRCSDEIFVTSRFLQAYCEEVWGRRALFFPNGVSEEIFIVPPATGLHRFGIAPFSYVVTVGRFMHDKAQHETIAAFIAFKVATGSEYAHLKLVLIGDSLFDKAYHEQLRMLAAERDDIIFAGTQQGGTLHALMSYALCGVQVSHAEGMPLATLELGAHGVPLVLSDISAHREIFGDSHTYTVVGDAAAIARQLEVVVRGDVEARSVSRAEAVRIKEQYNWEVNGARYAVSLAAHL